MPLPAVRSGNEWHNVPEAFKDISALQMMITDVKSTDMVMQENNIHQSISQSPSKSRLRVPTSPRGQFKSKDTRSGRNRSRRNRGNSASDNAKKFAGSDGSAKLVPHDGDEAQEGWGWTWFERFDLNLTWRESQR